MLNIKHKDYRKEVMAILFNQEDEFLVVSSKSYGKKIFSCPKGGVYTGENNIEALRRELREELGTNLEYKILQKSDVELIVCWPEEIASKYKQKGSHITTFWVQMINGHMDFNREEIDEIKWLAETNFFEFMGHKVKPEELEVLKREWLDINPKPKALT